mmetsp:Transcript_146327/g.469427  ORF Transcript_146327/g.469427 Transcript_146327/m.469427 type:complete len:130 (-) Transcript_146327:1007-1396(-)
MLGLVYDITGSSKRPCPTTVQYPGEHRCTKALRRRGAVLNGTANRDFSMVGAAWRRPRRSDRSLFGGQVDARAEPGEGPPRAAARAADPDTYAITFLVSGIAACIRTLFTAQMLAGLLAAGAVALPFRN